MGVGKTCISIRYAYGKFSNTHDATIGGCFLTKNEECDDHIVKFEIWDTAGQERYKSLAQMYYKKAIAACIVYDVTCDEIDPERIQTASQEESYYGGHMQIGDLANVEDAM